MKTPDPINAALDNAPGPVKSLLDHSRYTFIASILAVAWLFVGGCELLNESKVPGVFGTTQPVTRAELAEQAALWEFDYKARSDALVLEGQIMQRKFAGQLAALDVSDAKRTQFFGAITNAIGNIPGYGELILSLAIPALGIFAGGTLADNGRKGSILANRPKVDTLVRTGEA